MNLPLQDHRLEVTVDPAYSGMVPWYASLHYQAQRLGADYALIHQKPGEGIATMTLTAPDGLQSVMLVNVLPGQAGPVSEACLQAASGMMSVHGRSAREARPLGLDYAMTLAAVTGITGLMALQTGQRRGKQIQRAELSLLGSALTATGQYIADATCGAPDFNLLPGHCSVFLRPPFKSSDGVLFELEALDASPWLRFWQRLGVEDDIAGKAWKAFQLRYARAVSPLPETLFAATGEYEYAVLKGLCDETGMSMCPVNSLQSQAGKDTTRLSWQQGPWAFSEWQACSPSAPVSAAGLPLDGMQVIESCRRIQGPLAGHILAMLGADVIRLEPPGGDPLRGMPPVVAGCSARFSALNRLKQVQEVNIKTSEGRQQIAALVAQADGFIHNWAPDKADELALDHRHLAEVNPGLVYGYAGGWGRFMDDTTIPGTDFMAQAYSGVASEIANASGLKGGSLFTVLDVLGGAVAAQGVVAGLLMRESTQRAGKVETSLLGAANLLCAQSLAQIYKPDSNQTQCPDDWRMATLDGWLMITASRAQISDLISPLAKVHGESDPVTVFALQSGEYWLQQCQLNQLAAAKIIENLPDLATDPSIRGCVRQEDYLQIKSPWSFT